MLQGTPLTDLFCNPRYSGSVATKVATGNIKFAYGVQGASVGAVVSRFSTFLWRPLVVKLVPELEEHGLMDWVDLTVAGGFGAGAAWIRFACQTFF